jgi:mono/diheme cytochrome c family protein
MLHELSLPQALGVIPGAYGSRSACGAVVSSTVTVVDPDAVGFAPAAPMTGALVGADVAVSPSGQQLAVVSIASDDPGSAVQFYDVGATQDTSGTVNDGCWSPSPTPAMGDAGGDVTGDALPAPTSFLPANGEVVAVAYDARGNVIVQSREPATLQILTQRRDPIVLSEDSRFDLGHQVFHAATSGQIACVSCHPEGGEDGRVWQFQTLGARRTQSLRGGIMDTAPFHWGGDEPNMSSLMKDVFQGRMNGAAVDTQRITALGRWLDQIPTVPVARRTDDAHVDRGAALFLSAGCAACHAGADFTNGQTVDVGTGGQFQVPQLHGMALRAPYMHDGCAATLRDRFKVGCGGSDKHASGMFSDAQVDDLVAYLETL